MGKRKITECDVCGCHINTGNMWSSVGKSNTIARWPSLRRRLIYWLVGGFKYQILDRTTGWRRAYICADCKQAISTSVTTEREE